MSDDRKPLSVSQPDPDTVLVTNSDLNVTFAIRQTSRGKAAAYEMDKTPKGGADA